MTSSSNSTEAQNTERRESVFLQLAPILSTSYPTQSATRSDTRSLSLSSTSTLVAETSSSAIDMSATVDPTQQAIKERRSSSSSSSIISSDGTSRRRYLKLGPVHFGGDPSEADFVDAENA